MAYYPEFARKESKQCFVTVCEFPPAFYNIKFLFAGCRGRQVLSISGVVLLQKGIPKELAIQSLAILLCKMHLEMTVHLLSALEFY